ncbi:hypothetical protein FDECE_12489 [Fusarium decemcellulare]|nr:hypothetical protein FDECE_12489 [Fusarium decemcellulare]
MKKRFRACEACHSLKIKCEPSTTDPSVCERCARSSLTCEPAARRWQRDRIAELEEEVKSLQKKLDGTGPSAQLLSPHGSSARSISVVSIEGSDESSTPTGVFSSEPDHLRFLDARFDHESQLRCLEVYSRTAAGFWSIVPLANSHSARPWLESLRTEMPITLGAIIGFTMSPTDAGINPQAQNDLRTKVLEILGLAAVGLTDPSHDLAQAALVTGLWTRVSLDGNHGNCIQIVRLAHDLGVELGFGGPAMQSSSPAWFSRISGPLSLGMQETWVVSWVASTMAAIQLRRPHGFEWSKSHHDPLCALEENYSNPLFLEILCTVRLHADIASVFKLCDLQSVDINSNLVIATQARVRGRLDELSRRPLAGDAQLRFLRMLATIYANEPVLHTDANKTLFGAPYVAARIGVHEFARPPLVTGTIEIALRTLVEACHLAIDIVTCMDPSLILSLPSLYFGPAVSYTLSILVKVFVAVSAPGNTYSRVMSRNALRIKEAIGKLVAVKASLLKLDPYMGNWNTRIVGSVEWLSAWLDNYEAIVERYEHNLQMEAAERAIGGLSPHGHF